MSARKKKTLAKKPPPLTGASVLNVPFCWRLCDWNTVAPHVAPGSAAAARNLVREHKRDLEKAGVLTRLGRELVFYGGPYIAWMQRDAARKAVLAYKIAPNEEA